MRHWGTIPDNKKLRWVPAGTLRHRLVMRPGSTRTVHARILIPSDRNDARRETSRAMVLAS
jgi:hypothetical protein